MFRSDIFIKIYIYISWIYSIVVNIQGTNCFPDTNKMIVYSRCDTLKLGERSPKRKPSNNGIIEGVDPE